MVFLVIIVDNTVADYTLGWGVEYGGGGANAV